MKAGTTPNSSAVDRSNPNDTRAMKSIFFPCVAALAVIGTACSDLNSPAGAGNLTATELRSLALGVSVLATVEAEDLAWSGASFSISTADVDLSLLASTAAHPPHGGVGRGGLPLGFWGPRGLGIHGSTTTTVESTAPCPQGGSLNSLTNVSTVVDTVARTGTITTVSTDIPAACAFAVDSLSAALLTIANPNTVITVTGAPSIVSENIATYSWEEGVEARRGRFARAATTGSQTGSFTYSTSDGRSGTCAVDLAIVHDPDTRTHSITGTFCGQAIDITRNLPTPRRR